MSAQKPSKTRRRKSSAQGRPAAKIGVSEGGELTPLDYLLKRMNDETLSRMQRQAIAKKLAPYFHPKLKRLPAGQPPDYAFLTDPTDNVDAGSDAPPRERIRKKLFGRFD